MAGLSDIGDLRIAVLQTGRAVEGTIKTHGDYDDMCLALIGRTSNTADSFAVMDGEFPDGIDAYDVFVVTGSRHGVYEDHDWIPSLEDLIRKIYQTEKKLIGLCFGHQIIAQALGGHVVKSDKGYGVGLMPYDLIHQDGFKQPINLYAWHQDQVIQAPTEAEVILRSDFCPMAGLRYGARALTFQAHPEFTKGYMKCLFQRRGPDVLTQQKSALALDSLERPPDVSVIQTLLADFMTQSENQPISK